VAASDRGATGQDSTHVLVGRSSELKRIARCVEEAAQNGSALIIFGDPGVGKSALLKVAADQFSAHGGRVLTAVGVEHEAEIALSTLSLLLQPVQDHLDELAPAFGRCLSVALGFADGPAPSRLMMANSVLELLRLTADRTPVMVIVDDLQWVDRLSAAVLGLVGRRLAGTKICFWPARGLTRPASSRAPAYRRCAWRRWTARRRADWSTPNSPTWPLGSGDGY
jgi:hypothetical protein